MPGEGALSLIQPFLTAGTRAVIASYWNLHDQTSPPLVRRFYEELKATGSPRAALTTAKRQMLNDPEGSFRHPYYWAPYVLTGAPR